MLWCSQVKITRAFSVSEENGDVSWWASHPRSCDGIDWRGKRAACASTAEKSLHFRQHAVSSEEDGLTACARPVWPDEVPLSFGFEAMI